MPTTMEGMPLPSSFDLFFLPNDLYETSTPLHILTIRTHYPMDPNHLNAEAFQETARVLIEQGQHDPMAIDKHMTSPLHRYAGPLEMFKYMVNQQSQFDIDLEQRDDDGWGILDLTCVNVATFMNKPHYHGLYVVRYLYETGQLQPGWRYIWWILIALMVVGSCSTFDSPSSIPESVGAISLPMWLADLVPTFNWHLRYARLPVIIAYDCGSDENPAVYQDNDRRLLICLWLATLLTAGINLHDYFQDVDDIFDESTVLDNYHWRQGIKRIFTVEYGPDPDDVTILVQDVLVEISLEDCIPGAWTVDKTRYKTGLIARGLKPTANWRVSSKEEAVMSMVRSRAGPDSSVAL